MPSKGRHDGESAVASTSAAGQGTEASSRSKRRRAAERPSTSDQQQQAEASSTTSRSRRNRTRTAETPSDLGAAADTMHAPVPSKSDPTSPLPEASKKRKSSKSPSSQEKGKDKADLPVEPELEEQVHAVAKRAYEEGSARGRRRRASKGSKFSNGADRPTKRQRRKDDHAADELDCAHTVITLPEDDRATEDAAEVQVQTAAAQLQEYKQAKLVGEMRKREEQLQAQVAALTTQVKQREDVIHKQNDTLNAIHGACTCHICLESIWRPFVLVPCGHTFCLSCLVNWFQKPDSKEGSIPATYTESMRREEERWRTVHRKKVCPECRAAVIEQPVELWSMKLVLDKMDAGAAEIRELNAKVASAKAAEDGAAAAMSAAGGSDTAGASTSALRVDVEYGYDAGETAQQRDDKLGLTTRLKDAHKLVYGKQAGVWDGIFPALNNTAHAPRFDEADRVYRCPDCGCELEFGECPECGYIDEDSEMIHDDGIDLYRGYDVYGNRIYADDMDSFDSEYDEDYDSDEFGWGLPLVGTLIAARSEAAASATVPAANPTGAGATAGAGTAAGAPAGGAAAGANGAAGGAQHRIPDAWDEDSDSDDGHYYHHHSDGWDEYDEDGNLVGLIDDEDGQSLLSDEESILRSGASSDWEDADSEDGNDSDVQITASRQGPTARRRLTIAASEDSDEEVGAGRRRNAIAVSDGSEEEGDEMI